MLKTTEQREQRCQKLKRLKSKGIKPYQNLFKPTHQAEEIRDKFDELKESQVKIAGRIRSWRAHGKATFAHLEDFSGRLQVYFNFNQLGEEKYGLLELLDIGDIVGVEGKVFKTRRGEITVEVKDYSLLSKSLRPLPEKWHGLRDVEIRFRQRYLDLLSNPEIKKIFVMRSKIIQFMRAYFDGLGFQEVETPMLQPIPGGALARPFITYHNALSRNLYLRVAPELYLKRLVVGGLEKVYEINRSFRNEGISTQHNPEFTMLEVYKTYSNYGDMMELTEDLISKMASKILGTLSLYYQGNKIDLTPPWRREALLGLVKKHTEVDFRKIGEEEARAEAKRLGLEIEEDAGKWQIMEEAFERFVEGKLVQPTFVCDFPTSLSPLAKRKEDEPELAERFELFIGGGREIGNAFSELNDPLDQRERFKEQVERKKKGDEGAQMMDEDYLLSLEYGLPPTGGLGIGVDRLVMLFTDAHSIREVILFPQMREKEREWGLTPHS